VNHSFQTLYDATHNLNIYLHIGFGSIALVVGFLQLTNYKGGLMHQCMGRVFLGCFAVVITAAMLGILLFEFRLFLAALTLSSAYTCFAGYRVIYLKGMRPRLLDITLSTVCLSICCGFFFAVDAMDNNFSKVTIYATIGSLSLLSAYDLFRCFMSACWLRGSWLDEHIFKMLSAYGALLSAASGNLLSELGAVAQLSPVAITFSLSVFFIVLRQRKTANRSEHMRL